LGVSVTTADNVDNTRATVAALRTAFPSTPILMGGLAVATENAAHELGADRWARDGIAALQILDEVATQKPVRTKQAR
jgi:methanogenic corrinoid protein MtbC1